MEESMDEKKSTQSDSDSLVGGIIVGCVGLLFLLINLDVLPSISKSWPFLFIVVGAALVIRGLVQRKK
jgi:hypothetical protein